MSNEAVTTIEDLKAFIFPEGYGVDLVTEGREGKDDDGKNTIFVRLMHLVAPSGKVCCNCPLDPKSAYIFWHVNVTTEFGDLWCEESNARMRKEIAKLKGTGNEGD